MQDATELATSTKLDHIHIRQAALWLTLTKIQSWDIGVVDFQKHCKSLICNLCYLQMHETTLVGFKNINLAKSFGA
jgi:hypothetical protein